MISHYSSAALIRPAPISLDDPAVESNPATSSPPPSLRVQFHVPPRKRLFHFMSIIFSFRSGPFKCPL